MSGRAGRRGLDQSGHTIVHGSAPWWEEKIIPKLYMLKGIYIYMYICCYFQSSQKTTENS